MSSKAKKAAKSAIVNACLKEVVGERTPPDLTFKILERLAEMPTDAAVEDNTRVGTDVGSIEASPVAPVIKVSGSQGQAATSRPKISRRARWVMRSALVVLIGVTVGLGLLSLNRGENGGTEEVAEEQQDPNKSTLVPKNELASSDSQPEGAPIPEDRELKQAPFTTGPIQAPALAHNQKPAFENVEPQSDAEIINTINSFVKTAWAKHNIVASEMASDKEWCRRVYVRLINRVPNPDELAAFTESTRPDKRERLVQQLMSGSFGNEYAEAWGAIWTNLLVGRSPERGRRGRADREGLLTYLRESIANNVGYDQLAQRLVSAKGSNDPNATDYNPAINFLLANSGPKQALATSRVSRVFHGTQISCVQCHDHPTDKNLKQRHFWQVNAFFRQMKVTRSGQFAQLDNVDLKPNQDEAEIFFQQRDSQLKAAFPVFPNGREAPRTGLVSTFDRRSELAKALSDSPEFSLAHVNRMWSYFFGYGFTNPVDDMGRHNVPSHPQLLEYVAGQFASHGYDLRKLNRWLALSEPFALSSKIVGEPGADAPSELGIALFNRYYTRELSPETVFNSLNRMANRTNPVDNGTTFSQKFSKDMQNDEGNESNAYHGDIRRSMELMNGLLMERAVEIKPGTVLHKVVNSKLKFSDKLNHIFLAAVARQPLRGELKLAQEMKQQGVDEATVLQDIWWALLNSNEFILDH